MTIRTDDDGDVIAPVESVIFNEDEARLNAERLAFVWREEAGRLKRLLEEDE